MNNRSISNIKPNYSLALSVRLNKKKFKDHQDVKADVYVDDKIIQISHLNHSSDLLQAIASVLQIRINENRNSTFIPKMDLKITDLFDINLYFSMDFVFERDHISCLLDKIINADKLSAFKKGLRNHLFLSKQPEKPTITILQPAVAGMLHPPVVEIGNKLDLTISSPVSTNETIMPTNHSNNISLGELQRQFDNHVVQHAEFLKKINGNNNNKRSLESEIDEVLLSDIQRSESEEAQWPAFYSTFVDSLPTSQQPLKKAKNSEIPQIANSPNSFLNFPDYFKDDSLFDTQNSFSPQTK